MPWEGGFQMREIHTAAHRLLPAGRCAGRLCRNGFFGAGGGMALVPLLIWLSRPEDKAAFSSAIAAILPLCIVSIVIYALHDSLPVSDASSLSHRRCGRRRSCGASVPKNAGQGAAPDPRRCHPCGGHPPHRHADVLAPAAAAAGLVCGVLSGFRHRRRKPADGLDDRCPVHGAASGAGCESAVFSSLCGLRADLSYQK